MCFTEIILIAAGLAADAFSVSVCEGLAMKRFGSLRAACIALVCGTFQAVMLLAGYLCGSYFSGVTGTAGDHLAAGLLFVTGGKMIYSSVKEKDGIQYEKSSPPIRILFLAAATSIDALAFGAVFSAQKQDVFLTAAVTGIITFLMCLAGVGIGFFTGKNTGKQAGTIGGIILILIGAKILAGNIL